MANEIDAKSSGCTFQWKIENISHCWMNFGEKIDSPNFIADALVGSKWFLRLYPSGNLSKEYIACYLRRNEGCLELSPLVVHYQIAVLDKKGKFLQERMTSNYRFRAADYSGFNEYETRLRVFGTEREVFLPDDTLTLQCTIWNKTDRPAKTKHLYARTTFNVNRRNFLCRIEDFSSLKCYQRHAFKDSLIEVNLVLKEGIYLEKRLFLDIISVDESLKYFSFKASIIDAEGRKESCVKQEYFKVDLKAGLSFNLLLPTKLMESRSQYLPNDVLSLECEYVYSNGSISYEHCGYIKISPRFTNKLCENRNRDDNGKQELPNAAMASNDFKMMFNEAIFSDTEIRTPTQTFSAHKAILSARSPVFRNMFSNDMKEKNSGHVDITDFEDDTIHCMLLYMYTDSLDLQFESASKLYAIADKYEILSLKSKCSLFLKKNFCPGSVCEVLVLSDLHNDDDLRDAAQDYILSQDKEFFNSPVWKDFMKTHLGLSADVMHKKIFR